VTVPFRERDLETARNLPDEKHPAVLYLAQLGPGSRRTMTEAIEKLARLASGGQCDAQTLPWHGLRIEHTSALRARLAASMAPATANKHLAALRGVLKQAWRLGLISAENHQRAIDLPAVHGTPPRPHRALSAEELRALVAACERDTLPAGVRDAALFALLFGAGLRRSEVVTLDVGDYDRETGTLRVRPNGGRPQRRFTSNREGRQALDRWLERRGATEGPLFNPINKGGRIEVRRLSEQAIYVACRKRSAEAGLPPVSPEDLRRSLVLARPAPLRRVGPQQAPAIQSA
jgi:integrase